MGWPVVRADLVGLIEVPSVLFLCRRAHVQVLARPFARRLDDFEAFGLVGPGFGAIVRGGAPFATVAHGQNQQAVFRRQ
jgi:hypothetical protein